MTDSLYQKLIWNSGTVSTFHIRIWNASAAGLAEISSVLVMVTSAAPILYLFLLKERWNFL